ncbi:rhodanese-related sulfurtransferase [Buchnera aphidicola]|uniref:tRNA uridine(34) hydroxylase n=1 Tax=Buchnera aphidicola subsp. Tuberolachnus salignus TaxID=98804 RepID=A0A160SZ49_BUCTT|nr:rhodanese-related sulfurtransferase [Buchnera aphidicola]CUR53216.1 UPF0176 protein YceA [Buchnera aphidicola (Tuberolachnus salignus)]
MKLLKKFVSNKILKKKILIDTTKRFVLSFYKYFFIVNPQKILNKIKIIFEQNNVLGRIYISYEGINAQISVPENFINKIVYCVQNLHIDLKNLKIQKEIHNQKMAFWKLIIKIRPQIVSSQIKNFFFNPKKVGKHINARTVNKYIHNKNYVFVDMRNDYEYQIGHFKNSIICSANTFRKQLKNLPKFLEKFRNKNIVLYCTGGIRCEKTSSFLLFLGFKNVFQIKGGILGYIHESKKKKLPIYFLGRLFVFDSRLEERITQDIFSKCKNCNNFTNNKYINCKNNFCHLLFIQCNVCSSIFQSFCSKKCQIFKKTFC